MKGVDDTSINVRLQVDGYAQKEVTNIVTPDTDGCSSLSLKYSETGETYTYFSVGESIQASLKLTTTTLLPDGGSQSETSTLYASNPLTCTFGYANPSYSLTRVKFCAQISPI